LIGQWRYSLLTSTLTATMQIANRMYSLAQERNDSALLIKAHLALAGTLYWSGDFGAARQNALRSIQIWRSRGVQSAVEEVDEPAIPCLCYVALCEWHFGAIGSDLEPCVVGCHATMADAISLAKDLNDVVERFEWRCCFAELRRMRGVLLTAMDEDEDDIEAAFCEAVRLAKQISLEKRAEATCAEYCRQKASALRGHGLRLPPS
jgi:hypothetical protein